MDQIERQNRLIEYLRIKPINHGQIYTFQIAIPAYQNQVISTDRKNLLKGSLIAKGSNLIPLIVRRTQAYSEDEEYELVYGADWCLVAKELDIEKLWVWVFDLTDEQAEAAKLEMERLVGDDSNFLSPKVEKKLQPDGDYNIDKKLEEIQKLINSQTEQINQLTNQLNQKVDQDVEIGDFKKIQEFFSEIEQRLQQNVDFKIQDGLERLENYIRSQIDQLDTKLNQVIDHFPLKQSKTSKDISPTLNSEDETKINLLTTTQKEIQSKLGEIPGEAAYKAIEKWRNRKELTWKNLKKSTRSGEHKIENFGDKTYQKLEAIGYLPS